MKQLLLLFVTIWIREALSLTSVNFTMFNKYPFNFTSLKRPELNTLEDNRIEYNFKGSNENGNFKLICDNIIIIKQNLECNNCSETCFSIVENEVVQIKLCDGKTTNFVYQAASNELSVKLVINNKDNISFNCTVFPNIEPIPENITLHPNGKIQIITSPSEPERYFDHLWDFNSPENTRISFQCVIGLSDEMPNCGKNVLTFDDGKNSTDYCGSEYVVLFSNANKSRVRLQLDEVGDGYFECIVQAVTGPNSNEFENAVSVEVDSSEHGITPGNRNTSCACGRANKNIAKIMNGVGARKNEFPWMVYLNINKSQIWSSFCGGSIITSRHVLTAAHCLVTDDETPKVIEPNKVQVILGRHNTNVASFTERVLSVEKIFIQDIFLKEGTAYHDIAIIYTQENIIFNRVIGPICLDPQELPIVNRRIIILGWGKTEANKPSINLMKAKARVIDASICGGNEWDICTMTNPSSTCSGDSGGPLVWLDPETNRYTQVSLVSRGHDDCLSTSSISTKISYFFNWIQEIIKSTGTSETTCGKV